MSDALVAALLLLAACDAQPVPKPPTPARARPSGLDLATLTIESGGRRHVFTVEVARTEPQQAQGLMNRRALAPDAGMLFPFDPPRPASFWMRNTLIPLDLIFIRPDGTHRPDRHRHAALGDADGGRRAADRGARNPRRPRRQLGIGAGDRVAGPTRRLRLAASALGASAMGFFKNLFTWWDGATTGTALSAGGTAARSASDALGNVYFEGKKGGRRWVMYAGSNDVSRVPPEWYAWLTRQIDDVPDKALPPPPKFLKAGDAQPHRHGRRLSPVRRARARRPARGGERRLSGLDARLSRCARPLPASAWRPRSRSPPAARAGAGEQNQQNEAEYRERDGRHPADRDPARARDDADGASGSRCSACSTSATAMSRELTLRPGQAVRVGDVDRPAARLRDHRAVGGAAADRRLRPARRAQPAGPVPAGLLGLALQGDAVAQRRRAPDLRRLAQELRDDPSRRRHAGAFGRGRRAAGRAPRTRPGRPRRAGAAPRPAPRTLAERRRQQRQIVLLVDLDRAEALQVRRS